MKSAQKRCAVVVVMTAISWAGATATSKGQSPVGHVYDCPSLTVDPCQTAPMQPYSSDSTSPAPSTTSQPPPAPSPETTSPEPPQAAPSTPAPVSSGGYRGGDLIARSTSGDTFAARAPGSYIDSAIVANVFRFRFDSAYNNPLPDRVEFLYGGPGKGPLLIAGENDVDYQEFAPYFERVLSQNFSLFLETPFRLINGSIIDSTGGPSDLNVGFKRALYSDCNNFLTAQFKVFVPTGDAARGLGTGNVALEPGVLYLGRRSDRLIVQSEFRVWVPLSDTEDPNTPGRNFAGPVLRYGAGLGYDLLNLDTHCQRRRLAGTLEAVGWTITDGLASDPNNAGQFLDVSGDTIVNLKTGLRYTAGKHSFASAYGFNVTTERWYSDILRVEYRYAY